MTPSEHPFPAGDRLGSRLFSLLHTGNPGDIGFYRTACHGSEHVLELGCGHGRILIPLLQAGLRVTGLDRDPDLLEMAGRRVDALGEPERMRCRLVRADMRELEIEPAGFDRVLIAFNTLFCLRREEAADCLKRVYRHLAPGGRLLLDVYHVAPEDLPDHPLVESPEFLATIEGDGLQAEVYESGTWDPATQTVRVEYEYRIEKETGSKTYRQEQMHHYLFPGQIAGLLAEAGFDPAGIEWFGDFRLTRFTPRSDLILIRAAR